MSSIDRYILDDDGNPVPEPDLITWARSFETTKRIVDRTPVGEAEVSTVFLGIDHNFHLNGPPALFETLIFGGNHDMFGWRYSTRAEALAGHVRVVAALTDNTELPS